MTTNQDIMEDIRNGVYLISPRVLTYDQAMEACKYGYKVERERVQPVYPIAFDTDSGTYRYLDRCCDGSDMWMMTYKPTQEDIDATNWYAVQLIKR